MDIVGQGTLNGQSNEKKNIKKFDEKRNTFLKEQFVASSCKLNICALKWEMKIRLKELMQ